MNPKHMIDTPENRAFLQDMRDEMFSFGTRFPSPDGASYYLGDDGTPIKERPCETWITSRMVHVYSLAHNRGFKGADELIDAGLKGLMGALHDDVNGGWYAGVSSDGTILEGKHCYAHAFVILAATSALKAGRNDADKLLNDALKTYDKYFWDEDAGLSSDTWDTEFTRLDNYRGLNANMHSVEAFLAVADVTGDKAYRVRAGRIIDHVIGWAGNNDWRIPEHFSEKWIADLDCNKDRPDDQFKPYGATPGHGIEWARLITQWALSSGLGSDKQSDYITAAKSLYKRAIDDAWNSDGAPGFVYTTDWTGRPVVHDRMHWTLAEAINTSAVLYRVTKDASYASDYSMFMEYLDSYVYDHKNGSWYHQLDKKNNPIDTVWPGKPDLYHAVQATMIPYAKDVSVSVIGI